MKVTEKPTFQERIQAYSAKQIAEAVGCPLPTAYDWASGRRKPPSWLQDKLVRDVERHAKKG